MLLDDLADELDDVEFEEDPDDDKGWETEDEMEAEQDDSELTFSSHTGNPLAFHKLYMGQLCFKPTLFFSFFFFVCPGSVFCVSLDPASNTLAVTGGEDDKAYVWRVSDGEVLFECTGKYQIHLMITIKNVTFLVC